MSSSHHIALAAAALLLALTCAQPAQTQQPRAGNCAQSETPQPASLRARFAQADELLERGCNEAALKLLEAGEQAGEANPELQRRVRDARSLVSEQRYIEGLSQAEEAAKLQRLLLRCQRLGDINACDDAVKTAPGNTAAAAARTDAVRKLAASCLGAGTTALADCEAALLRNPADAPALVARRQVLLNGGRAPDPVAAPRPAKPAGPATAGSAKPAPSVAANTRRYSNDETVNRSH